MNTTARHSHEAAWQHWFRPSIAALTLAGAVAPAEAQTTATGDQPRTLKKVEVVADELGEITEGTGSYAPGKIATATRMVLTPRETPQSISVITREEIEDFNLTSIDRVMEHTPGVSLMIQDSERTAYFVRGFQVNTFQYDGVPMERNSGYSSGNTLSDMAIYDRVEVLKGATGLLTGSGDPGATINLIRKKPTQDFQASLLTGFGRWDSYRGQLDVSGAFTDSVRGRFVTAYQDKDSYQDGHERKTTVFYGIVEADLTPNTLLTLGADYQDNDPRQSSWGGVPLFDTTGAFNDVPRSFNNGVTWSYWEQYTRTGFATLEHQFANNWVAKLQLNHQINGYDSEISGAAAGNPNPITGAGVRLFGPSRYEGETESNVLDFYLRGPFGWLGRTHELVAGINVARRHWQSDLYLRPLGYDQNVPNFYAWSGNAAYPASWRYSSSIDEKTDEDAAYLTARFNVRDDLKLITGARVINFERGEIDESGMVVPYVGATYDLNANHSLYASYSTIFKPQTSRDEAGRSLDPLGGKNYEVGYKSSLFEGGLIASVALFQLEQENFAELTGGVTPAGQPAYREVDGVRTRGYELEIAGELTPSWSLHGGYSHKVAKQRGTKVATLTPEGQFTLFSKYQFSGALDRLSLGGGVRWQDKTWAQVANPAAGRVRHTVSSYALVDAIASYRVTDGLLAQLSVTNLLDKEYYTIFESFSTYTWGEPRNVTLNLSYNY